MWETNFVPDLAAIELTAWNERGAGSMNLMFLLADGNMHLARVGDPDRNVQARRTGIAWARTSSR